MIDVFFSPPCNLIRQADDRCILKWILLSYIFRFSKGFNLYVYTHSYIYVTNDNLKAVAMFFERFLTVFQ